MNEAEWLATPLVQPMLDLLFTTTGLIYKRCVQQHPRGRRRLRLFGTAVARRTLPIVSNPIFHQLLDVAESLADGGSSVALLQRLLAEVEIGRYGAIREDIGPETARSLLSVSSRMAFACRAIVNFSQGPVTFFQGHTMAALAIEGENLALEVARQASLLREIFGNPFSLHGFPIPFQSPMNATLAQAAYEERHLPSGHLDNARLAVLSDALEETGCTDADLLTHLRSPGPHVRGCWALDLVLGKS